jgi:hypothetical protein
MKIQRKYEVPPIINAILYDGNNLSEIENAILSEYDKDEYGVAFWDDEYGGSIVIKKFMAIIPIRKGNYYGVLEKNVLMFTEEMINDHFNIIEK